MAFLALAAIALAALLIFVFFMPETMRNNEEQPNKTETNGANESKLAAS